MPFWSRPQRPAAYAEQALVKAILDGTYPAGTALPAERSLAKALGVTRPTLREALQRLERDGWLSINQGKPTRVRDYWRDGGLNVLNAIVQYGGSLPPDFVTRLLEVRLAMAPAYVRAAIDHNPQPVIAHLERHTALDDTPAAFASYDWALHHILTVASGNPVYTLILNGFAGFYERLARHYYAQSEARHASFAYYAALLPLARSGEAADAERLSREVMQASISLWERAQGR
ncbi:MAG: fatty acid metabolism transcriptional regulator FadR [Anaerolineae bacterium]